MHFPHFRQKSSQNMCEVELKDESSDENSDGHSAKRPYSLIHSLAGQNGINNLTSNGSSEDIPSLSINNVAATLDTLKMLKNGNFSSSAQSLSFANNHQDEYAESFNGTNGGGGSNDNNCVKQILKMQNKEHIIRMEILQVQLQTAHFNRDAAQINKMIAITKLKENNLLSNEEEN